jgi:hypothetical protein
MTGELRPCLTNKQSRSTKPLNEILQILQIKDQQARFRNIEFH